MCGIACHQISGKTEEAGMRHILNYLVFLISVMMLIIVSFVIL